MKLTIIIQDYVHVVHAGGSVKYRAVQITLTPEQESALALIHEYEDYGIIAIDKEPAPPQSSEGGE